MVYTLWCFELYPSRNARGVKRLVFHQSYCWGGFVVKLGDRLKALAVIMDWGIQVASSQATLWSFTGGGLALHLVNLGSWKSLAHSGFIREALEIL